MIKPILFSTEMVRAILDGRKTQTRRIMKPQPELLEDRMKMPLPIDEAAEILNTLHKEGRKILYTTDELKGYAGPKYPCRPGDILWVRETWCVSKGYDDLSPLEIPKNLPYTPHYYIADGPKPEWAGKTRVSIHMPKDACRLFLRVTDVRAERLQDISEEDALAEGINLHVPVPGDGEPNPRLQFKHLWDSINAKRGCSWDTNPWVWCYTFELTDRPEGWPL